MKKIKLLSYFLLSILSAHVAASEGSGYKIISERTEMTPGIKGWIVKNNNYLTKVHGESSDIHKSKATLAVTKQDS